MERRLTGYTKPDWDMYYYKFFTDINLLIHDSIYKKRCDKTNISKKIEIIIRDIPEKPK